ncbi:MAG: GAF domain-containing sensor histidine kinase [Halobacteriota archaeon]
MVAQTGAVLVVDSDGQVVDCNRCARTLLASVDALVDRPLEAVVPSIWSALQTPTNRPRVTVDTGDGQRTLRVDVVDCDHGTRIVRFWNPERTPDAHPSARRLQVERLHEVVVDLGSARRADEVYQCVVDGATAVTDADCCRLSVVEGARLVPTASSREEPVESCDPIPVGAGIAGHAYETNAASVISDLRASRGGSRATDTAQGASGHASASDSPTDALDPVDAIDSRPAEDDSAPVEDDAASDRAEPDDPRSLLTVPLDGVGVVQAFDSRPDAFDAFDRALLELLFVQAGQTLQRIDVEDAVSHERARLESFATALSHDLRSPLNAAMGRLELLQEEYDTAHVDAIDSTHDRMVELINDLLAFTLQGEAIGETDSLALRRVVDDAWQSVDAPDAELVVEGDLPSVEADRTRLYELLLNAFSNAVQHADTPVTVRVGPLSDGGFFVADDGPGIAPSNREAVFERGYTTARDGTGFGLPIVQRIADAHDWDLRLTESNDGGVRLAVRI